MNIHTILPKHYPRLLRTIPQLPDHLEVYGEIPNDSHIFLCVIGARSCTPYGKEVCDRLIQGLRDYPIVIVSGLAIGIDSIAHETALTYGLKTIAFPGSGLDPRVLYPPMHRALAQRIVTSGGALVSPFKASQTCTPWTFPFRNRLMAGISHATLIIEAKQGSGTLLTAEYATQFNRDILAVPGSILNESSYGPHMLIARGAVPITHSQDILDALGFTGTPPSKQRSLLDIPDHQWSPDERTLCEHLKAGSYSSTELIEMTGMSPSQFNTCISELELHGVVSKQQGRYRIV